ncbi:MULTISPECIES: hypothetical protein [unclassified Pseudovibrio]|uniref:hypothetical protein n=1 Tax=unclassified Pseudovibrio TaxID=2627060 RepID=UPI0012EE886E|nr:hypothetical protein [Pseudovibrio sp. JE062]
MRTSTLLVLTSTLALIVSTSAFARPDTRQMSCLEARSVVQRAGGIVLSTGARTYDRFVAGLQFCQPYERLMSRWVPTKDQKRCFIGYSCEPGYNSGEGPFGSDIFD